VAKPLRPVLESFPGSGYAITENRSPVRHSLK
jgi:hypothetical protein